ncbi:MAG: DUF4097 family beta strand repeat protein [Acidobacteria bacterium]|nr:DUF4097 family beta strand repeat protein [Acidobacteriota bacterium]
MKNQGLRVLISLTIALLFGRMGMSQVVIPAPMPAVRISAHAHPHVHVNEWEESLTVTEQEEIRKSFPFPAGTEPRNLTIDDVWGSVHVTGGSGDQVEVVAKKTIRAESKEALEQARKDVSLDITQQPTLLKLYVNGPFRCQCDCGCNGNHERPGYIVKYDFEIQTPRAVNLNVRTVNDGDVKVQEIAGKYSVQNVNGPVEMTNVAGSGSAKTVNGDLKVLFRDNPQTDSSFATLNGDVDLYFLQKLSADLRFKTFNGEIFSDFQMAALPPRQPEEQRQGTKFVFRADRYSGGRVAGGGPEIKIETLNGDIHIRERHD